MEFVYRDSLIYYIGVGASYAPSNVVSTMYKLGCRFAELGYGLRTLDNSEIDRAIRKGCQDSCGKVTVYVPWQKNNNDNVLYVKPTQESYSHCDRMNPAFEKMHMQTKAIKARIANLLFGNDTEIAAKFIVCWSKDAAENISSITKETGEISDVLEMKPTYSMPVFNLQNSDAMQRLGELINSNKKSKHASQIHVEQLINSIESNPYFENLINEYRVERIYIDRSQNFDFKSIITSK